MAIKKKKISELPLADTLVGLYTIGVNALNKSVKVGLEFLKTAADAATSAATSANNAASSATAAATSANNAASSATAAASGVNTAKNAANAAAGEANNAATIATNAATAATSASNSANTAASGANTAKDLANTAATNANTAANAASLSRDTEVGVWRYINIPTGNTKHRYATHLQLLPNGNIFLVSPTENYIYDKFYNRVARSAGLFDYSFFNSRLCAIDDNYIYFVSKTEIIKLDFNLKIILRKTLPVESQQQHPFVFYYFGQICLFANKTVYDVNVDDLYLSPKIVVYKGIEFSLSNIIALAHNEKLNVFTAFGVTRTSDNQPCIITKYGELDSNCAIVSDASYARSVTTINRIKSVEPITSIYDLYFGAFTSDGFVILFSLASDQFNKTSEVKLSTDYNVQISPLPAVYNKYMAYDCFNGIVYDPNPYKVFELATGTVCMNRFGTLIGAKNMLDKNGSAIQRLP